MFSTIKKRDGRVAAFDESKITRAIWNAGRATGEFGESEALKLKDKVIARAAEELRAAIPGGRADPGYRGGYAAGFTL